MLLEPRPCSVCLTPQPFAVVTKANYDMNQLDSFAFSSRKFPENMHFQIVRCERCRLLFANPAPSEADLAKRYEAAEYDSSDLADNAAKTYARYLKPYLNLLPSTERALEIGSGNGAFLAQLFHLGFQDVSGVEPSVAPVNSATPAIRRTIKQSIFRSEDYSPNQFDLICCFQTLEHVYAPGELVRDCYKLLKPGGAIFLVAHNYRGWLNRILGTKSPIFDVEHLQLFAPGPLKTMLRNAGFHSVVVFPVVNRFPFHYWLKLAPIKRKTKQRIIALSNRVGLGNKPFSLPAGNLGAVAFKKTS